MITISSKVSSRWFYRGFCNGRLSTVIGQYDVGEGIEDVKIYLYNDTDEDGLEDGMPIDSVLTDEFGSYGFSPVDPGDYVLVEVQPEGYLNGYDEDVTEDVDDAINVDDEDDRIPVTVDPDELDDDNLFIEVTECQLVVSILDNDGTGSLRAAIECAGPGDTIKFAPIIEADTIVLTTTLNINKDVIIWNTLSQPVYVMLDNPDPIGILGGNTVEVQGINVISGNTNAPAAIDNYGSLILDNVEVYRNEALPIGTILVENKGDLTLRGQSRIIED